ncbi:MAG: multiheme c-type cytochrome, partial [Myxococcota bacterium]
MREVGLILAVVLLFVDPLWPSRSSAEPVDAGQRVTGTRPRAAATVGIQGIDFAANETCVGCHSDQAASWRASHHALAMQRATSETVLGDFDDARFEHFGVSTRFSRKGQKFSVSREEAAGATREYSAAYTFGVHPLQQYLVEFPGGRLQALSVAWDVEKKEWFSLYSDSEMRSDDALSLAGRYQTWNSMCAECHSTAFEKNYDKKSDTYASTWAEINVSCQSCHGPGARHVEWARAGGQGAGGEVGLAVEFGVSRPRVEIETCAPCHSRRHPVSASDLTGGPLLDDFLPSTLDQGLYQVDGQILEEVYVHGSFVQSKMHAAGVRCTDCHDPHGLDLVSQGDA